MKNNKKSVWIKDQIRSYLDSIDPKMELFFRILLGFYVAFYFYLKVKWNENVDTESIRLSFVGVIMWGSALYLLISIAAWKGLRKNKVPLIITGVILIALAAMFSTRLSTNSFGVVFDLFLCFMVFGKDYKKILRNTMWIGIGTLLFCFFGMIAGITQDVVKPNNANPGHSLGTVYPNTWGYLAFLILLIVWYLYLRRKSFWHGILTFVIFWSASAFLHFYICCRTITGLTVTFPLLALLADWLEERADSTDLKKLEAQAIEEEQSRRLREQRKAATKRGRGKKGTLKEVFSVAEAEKNGGGNNADITVAAPVMKKTDDQPVLFMVKAAGYIRQALEWLTIGMPYLAFTFVMFMSSHVEWLHKHFYYTPLHNLAMRFVQGGLYFKVYGIPLVGNPYDARKIAYVDVNGEFLEVGILDSSYASYIITRGILWVLLCMLWLCIANWKALKKRDFGIPLISLFLLGFAMMERPGLELWYNFILLYPLAKVESKPGTDIFRPGK